MKSHFIPISILSLLLIILCTSCEELAVDSGSVFEAPSSEQTPLVNNLNENINGSNAHFSWEGNEFALQFSYQLEINSISGLNDPLQIIYQPYNNWSDWSTDHSTVFSKLDDGNYTFYVKSRFNENEEIEPHMSNSFEIDAISGPALRIYPQNQTAQPGEEIDVYLFFEDVPGALAVTGLEVDIQINTDELEFINGGFQYGDLITGFPGTTIYPDPSYSEDGASLSIVGVADDNGLGIYGTGSIAKVHLRVKDQVGTFQILIYQEENAFQDINGNAHGFNDPVSGTVTVEGAAQ